MCGKPIHQDKKGEWRHDSTGSHYCAFTQPKAFPKTPSEPRPVHAVVMTGLPVIHPPEPDAPLSAFDREPYSDKEYRDGRGNITRYI